MLHKLHRWVRACGSLRVLGVGCRKFGSSDANEQWMVAFGNLCEPSRPGTSCTRPRPRACWLYSSELRGRRGKYLVFPGQIGRICGAAGQAVGLLLTFTLFTLSTCVTSNHVFIKRFEVCGGYEMIPARERRVDPVWWLFWASSRRVT